MPFPYTFPFNFDTEGEIVTLAGSLSSLAYIPDVPVKRTRGILGSISANLAESGVGMRCIKRLRGKHYG